MARRSAHATLRQPRDVCARLRACLCLACVHMCACICNASASVCVRAFCMVRMLVWSTGPAGSWYGSAFVCTCRVSVRSTQVACECFEIAQPDSAARALIRHSSVAISGCVLCLRAVFFVLINRVASWLIGHTLTLVCGALWDALIARECRMGAVAVERKECRAWWAAMDCESSKSRGRLLPCCCVLLLHQYWLGLACVLCFSPCSAVGHPTVPDNTLTKKCVCSVWQDISTTAAMNAAVCFFLVLRLCSPSKVLPAFQMHVCLHAVLPGGSAFACQCTARVCEWVCWPARTA
jgi:hypothetical protein